MLLGTYDPRHSNPMAPEPEGPGARGIFMTGVHWLLAHCSVLKVRGCRPGRRLLFRHKKAAGLAADGAESVRMLFAAATPGVPPRAVPLSGGGSLPGRLSPSKFLGDTAMVGGPPGAVN